MVPISSSQVIIGCVMGIGIYKGARNINFKMLGEIALGWLATPVISGLLAFLSLFFVKNLFNINVGEKSISTTSQITGLTEKIHTPEMAGGSTDISGIIKYLLIGLIIFGVIAISYCYLLERKKSRELVKSEEKFWKNIK